MEVGGEAGPRDLLELRWPRPGLTVVISDCLVDEAGWTPALAGVRARRQEPVLWQVLAPDEEDPAISGDLKLVDEKVPFRKILAMLEKHRGIERVKDRAQTFTDKARALISEFPELKPPPSRSVTGCRSQSAWLWQIKSRVTIELSMWS